MEQKNENFDKLTLDAFVNDEVINFKFDDVIINDKN